MALTHLLSISEEGREGPGRAWALPRPLLTVPNVTAHPSMASVPITLLLYNGPVLCGFNVAINGKSTAAYQSTKQNLICTLLNDSAY